MESSSAAEGEHSSAPVVIVDLHERDHLRMALATASHVHNVDALERSIHTCSQRIYYINVVARAADSAESAAPPIVMDEFGAGLLAMLGAGSMVRGRRLHIHLLSEGTEATGEESIGMSVPAEEQEGQGEQKSSSTSCSLCVLGLRAERASEELLLQEATLAAAGVLPTGVFCTITLHFTHASATTAAGGAARCVGAIRVTTPVERAPGMSAQGVPTFYPPAMARACAHLLARCAEHTIGVGELRGKRVLVCDRVFGRDGRGCLLAALHLLEAAAVFVASSPYFALNAAAEECTPAPATPERTRETTVPQVPSPVTGLTVEFAADATVVSIAWENKLCNWASSSVCLDSLEQQVCGRIGCLPMRWQPRVHRFFPRAFRELVFLLLLVRQRSESALHRLPLELFFLVLEHLATETGLLPSQADLLVRTTVVSPPQQLGGKGDGHAPEASEIPLPPTVWQQDTLEQVRLAVGESYFRPRRHLYDMPLTVSRWRVILSEDRGVHHLLLHCLSNISSAVERQVTANPVRLVVHGAAALPGLAMCLAHELDALHRHSYAYCYRGEDAHERLPSPALRCSAEQFTWVRLADLTTCGVLLADPHALEPVLWRAYTRVALHPYTTYVSRHSDWFEMWLRGKQLRHLFADE
jgi:hypothetical protein